MSVEPPELCAECGAPLAGDQHYCLACGARAGSRSPQLVSLLQRLRERSQMGDGPPRGAAQVPEAARTTPRPPGLRLPAPRVSALLVLVFLGFGVLMGDAAGSRVNDTLAASARRLKVVLAPAGSPGSTAATSTSSSPSSGESPESQAPESTPAPTPATPARTTSSSARAPSSSSSSPAAGEGGSKEAGGGGSGEAAGGSSSKLPPVKHVFVIMLSDQPYASVFGPASSASYLSQTLEQRGELLVRYDAVAHEELANGIALLSGEGPTAETAANCPNYTDIVPASSGADEQVLGNGCVYPASTQTLAGQLTAKHLSWRAYIQGMDEAGTSAGASAGACAHSVLGQADPTASQASSSGPYATFRNPLVYFHAVIDSPACATDDVGLARLKADLAASARTPSFSYIVPDRCHDGNPTPCSAGAPAGLVPAGGFLEQVVPEIMGSKAYKQDGLLVITVDEAPSSGEFADSSSCCGQPLFPNAPSRTPAGAPRGGGTVGALLLSPFLVKPGSTSQEPYNHFSLLATIEDLFGLKHLGYAALAAVKPFEAALFSSRAHG